MFTQRTQTTRAVTGYVVLHYMFTLQYKAGFALLELLHYPVDTNEHFLYLFQTKGLQLLKQKSPKMTEVFFSYKTFSVKYLQDL